MTIKEMKAQIKKKQEELSALTEGTSEYNVLLKQKQRLEENLRTLTEEEEDNGDGNDDDTDDDSSDSGDDDSDDDNGGSGGDDDGDSDDDNDDADNDDDDTEEDEEVDMATAFMNNDMETFNKLVHDKVVNAVRSSIDK